MEPEALALRLNGITQGGGASTYRLSVCCVPGAVLGAGEAAMTERWEEVLARGRQADAGLEAWAGWDGWGAAQDFSPSFLALQPGKVGIPMRPRAPPRGGGCSREVSRSPE